MYKITVFDSKQNYIENIYLGNNEKIQFYKDKVLMNLPPYKMKSGNKLKDGRSVLNVNKISWIKYILVKIFNKGL